jgi:hypothetical protein
MAYNPAGKLALVVGGGPAPGINGVISSATIEAVNGIVHPLWSLRQGGYTPGVATAPILLVLALVLAQRLRDGSATPS